MIIDYTYGAIQQDVYQSGIRSWNWSSTELGNIHGPLSIAACDVFIPGGVEADVFVPHGCHTDLFVPRGEEIDIELP